ncbi:hypothetical protein DI09_68p90 [Mitosporidium daphniae]|uniref:Uncharacterized protein n=1 Tax=Mitosporidium daphniae TaxID=1485682 RepID=A0A098VS00_9MICR|nr:uncharacterized protein DI09_68p90 [Mitosporidium daphniae]KGG50501.1 hypothetical protein DI09_68p90 [Mitosporidium daphniae]|eukprot:XP_013236948.1 uncharacterized protein DI09_68p90 [Mitosporidium daphniae]
MVFCPGLGSHPLRKLNQIYGSVILTYHSFEGCKFLLSAIPSELLSLKPGPLGFSNVNSTRALGAYKTHNLKTADLKYEKIVTIPNMISVCRIGLSPILCYFVVKNNLFVSFPLFMLCAISDWVNDPLILVGRWIHSSKVWHAKQAGDIFGSSVRQNLCRVFGLLPRIQLDDFKYACKLITFAVPVFGIIVARDILLLLSSLYLKMKVSSSSHVIKHRKRLQITFPKFSLHALARFLFCQIL